MAGKTPEVQLLGETLTRQYRLACELYNTFPVGRYTHLLSQGILSVDLTSIDHDHMEAFCHLLQSKTTPFMLKFSIPTSKEVGPRIIHQAVRGISLCVAQSVTLTSLDIFNIKLKGSNFEMLCQGLSKARNLKTLIIASCSLRDVGVERLCQSIKNVPCISTLSLPDCYITEKGAETIARLLKHQRMNRDSAMWQDTLRLRQPHLDGMRGLRRITLNHNPHLGDSGAKFLSEALLEDLWIKAVDLQHCGIGTEGGLALRKILKTNHTIEVLDLRKNPFLPSQTVNDVISLLRGRLDEYTVSQYEWLSSEIDQDLKEKGSLKENKYLKVGIPDRNVCKEKHQKQSKESNASRKTPPPNRSGVPWRVEHRLFERREGLKPGSAMESFIRGDLSTPLPVQNVEASSQTKTVLLKKFKKMLSHYKHLYRKEKEARKRAERKIAKLQSKIERSHVLDEGTVAHIETCFQKFQAFLINLKTAGFQWQGELWEHPHMEEPIEELLTMGQAVFPSYSRHSGDLYDGDQNADAFVYRDSRLLSFSTLNHPFILRNEKSVDESHPDQNLSQKVIKAKDTLSESKIPVDPTANIAVEVEQHQRLDEVHLYEEAQHHMDKDFSSSFFKSSNKNIYEKEHEDVVSNTNIPVMPEKVNSSKEKDSSSSEDPGTVINYEEEAYTNRSNEVPLVSQLIRQSESLKSEDTILEAESKAKIQEEQDGKDGLNQRINEDAEESEMDVHEDAAESHGNSSFPIFVQGKKSPYHLIGVDTSQTKLENEVQNPTDIPNVQTLERKSPSQTIISFSNDKGIKETERGPDQDNALLLDENDSEITDTQIYSQRSETDDEKLQMKRTIKRAARSGSISSVSITEQLSHSHSNWTGLGKARTNNCLAKNNSYKNKRNEMALSNLAQAKEITGGIPKIAPKDEIHLDYDSDFEVSDIEGISISASSLTSTTLPDDLVTPGEEEF